MNNFPDYGSPQQVPNFPAPEPTPQTPLPPWVPGQKSARAGFGALFRCSVSAVRVRP